MELSPERIRSLFPPKEYAAARRAHETYGNVYLQKEISLEREIVKTSIRDARSVIEVCIVYEEPDFSFSCTCADFKKNKCCCHCAWVLISYEEQQREQWNRGSSDDAGWLLRRYAGRQLETATSPDGEEGRLADGFVTVQPQLYLRGIGSSSYGYGGIQRFPQISVTVGSRAERQYVVHDLTEFLARFEEEETFRKNMQPFLYGLKTELYFTAEDFTNFYSYVFPHIRKYVTLRDPDGLLEKYCPEECTPRFLLDYSREKRELSARLLLRYGETEVKPGTPSIENAPSLFTAVQLLQPLSPPSSAGSVPPSSPHIPPRCEHTHCARPASCRDSAGNTAPPTGVR